MTFDHDRAPCGEAGGRQRGRLLETQSGGNRHEGGLIDDDVIAVHAVDARAQRAIEAVMSRRTVVPVPPVHARDALSDLELARARAQRGDFTGAVGAGDHAGPVARGVEVLDVAAVEGDGAHVHEHLAGTGLRHRCFDRDQTIAVGRFLVDHLACGRRQRLSGGLRDGQCGRQYDDGGERIQRAV
jgi:hypothetical protein